MRVVFVTLLLVVFVWATTHAQICDQIMLDCPTVVYPGTWCGTLVITNCEGVIDAFGVEILYPTEYLSLLSIVTAGTLTEGWDEIDAAIVDGEPNRLRIGGYDLVGFGIVQQDVLVRICFDLIGDAPTGTVVTIDSQSLEDDIASFTAVSCTLRNIVPIETTTWGRIKALWGPPDAFP
ncbi:MAG: hypothetical protein JSW58_00190 [Candidatus Latescibacterota bacterium]|nr:MAG: hypothetical protein JSW58_00190 [Candidatus Latescibacterota bacterium]